MSAFRSEVTEQTDNADVARSPDVENYFGGAFFANWIPVLEENPAFVFKNNGNNTTLFHINSSSRDW